MDIRSDRQKGLSYVELGKKYHAVISQVPNPATPRMESVN